MNIQGQFPLESTSLISLQSKGLSRVFSRTSLKASILQCSAFFMIWLSHLYMTFGKTISLTIWTIVGKVMSLLFNTLSRFVIVFSSKEQVSFNFVSPVTVCSDFGAQENKIWHCFHFSPSICHEVIGQDAAILVFWMLSLKSTFSLSSFTFIKRLFSSSSHSAIRVGSSTKLRLLIELINRSKTLNFVCMGVQIYEAFL